MISKGNLKLEQDHSNGVKWTQSECYKIKNNDPRERARKVRREAKSFLVQFAEKFQTEISFFANFSCVEQIKDADVLKVD